MMDYDARIAELEEQLDSLERREIVFHRDGLSGIGRRAQPKNRCPARIGR